MQKNIPPPEMMDDSPHLYISEDEDMVEEEEEEEGDMKEVHREETGAFDDDHDYVYHHGARSERGPVPGCRGESRPGSKQSLEGCAQASPRNQGRAHRRHNTNQASRSTDTPGSATQTAGTFSQCASSVVPATNKQADVDENHSCRYCQKAFNTHTNKRRHERRVHERHLRGKREENTHQEHLEGASSAPRQGPRLGDGTALVAAPDGGERAEHYMLDVSSSISENLSIYIDGKIVSTSTVGGCEVVDVNSGSSHLVGLDPLILDPAQIGHALTADALVSKEIHCQPLARRRTATPPLLPQIKTELESEVIVSSSTASLVSTLIESLLPRSTDSIVLQREKTVFLSPKLKQILEKQDGLKPTLALIADGQNLCSPLSLSVLPAGAGRFKRRTGTPPTSPQQNSSSDVETGDAECVIVVQNETRHASPLHTTPNEDKSTPPVKEPVTGHDAPESWPSITGGNSCNQQPLDLSNAIKRNEGRGLAEAVLDLSLQKRLPGDPFEPTSDSATPALVKKGKPNACMLEKVLLNEYANDDSEQNLHPGAPLVTDVAIVAGSELVSSVQPLREGLVYGLALPCGSLHPSPSSLTPVALQPSSCTIALASPASHSLLPATPSLITVLAPPASMSNPSNQAIQVLAPNVAPEPLVICAENTISPSECDLTTAFSATNAANLVTLTQPLDPGLNLPGHVFLTDPIALNTPVLESVIGSEGPFSPLNNSLLNSYNITSNTVLIECTISLDAPGNIVPAAIALQENTVEPPALTKMVINHVERQQIVSLPDSQSVDPTALVSSVAESVTLSATSAAESESPAVGESPHGPEPAAPKEQSPPREEQPPDDSLSAPDVSAETPPPSEPGDVKEPSKDAPSEGQEQTFAKNFVCNVCDALFHSMKELGRHVGEHAEQWPYKCEFCVLLFGTPPDLLEHRSHLHGVGATYLCSACTKEFVYLCNLKHHQEELHPGQQCTYTEEEKGKLRPPNYNHASKGNPETSVSPASEESKRAVKTEGGAVDAAAEELLTTIKILASDGGKGHDVRLGLNQHYPSFKPPPFPYHNRSPAGSMASATNFTTHNIPQTFSTAIRCTKCGKGFDNMPELHKHILSCANASDKRRYTPKKNPIPLRHFAKAQIGVLSTTNSTNGLNGSHRASQGNGSKPYQEPVKVKLSALSKKKKKFIQRAMSQRYKSAAASNKTASANDEQELFACPHCSREFTLRRSRTKHMAVCPKKHNAARNRKDGGVSVTKENHVNLRRGTVHLEDKRQASAHDQKARVQPSSPAKRPAILPVQTVLSSKKSKIVIRESVQPKREVPALEPPVSRTFSPSMRQYSRVQHGVREMPIKITIAKPQQTQPQSREKPPPGLSREGGSVAGGRQQNATAKEKPGTTPHSPGKQQDPVV